MRAQESIPTCILLHPRSIHDVPEERRVEARRQGAIDGGGEVMRAQATHGDQEDCPHQLRRACPNRSNPISLPHQGGEGISTPVRRSERIQGMRITRRCHPSLKTMRGVTIPMIVDRTRGRPPEGKTMTCIIGKRCQGEDS
jgi:hypothetical protein